MIPLIENFMNDESKNQEVFGFTLIILSRHR